MSLERFELAIHAARVQEGYRRRQALACKVCGAPTSIFDVVDFARRCARPKPYLDGLSGIPVYYHRCSQCGFLFTDFFDAFSETMWRSYVYNSDYQRIDPEYVAGRPERNASLVRAAIEEFWSENDRGCDFGGGLGTTARLLRETGFDFDSIDPFGANMPESTGRRYKIVTAFEVLEHSPQPVQTFKELSDLCYPEQAILIASTSLVPRGLKSGELISWWYAAPRNGHISLFTAAALAKLAAQHNFIYRQVTRTIHVFSRGVSVRVIARRLLVAKILQRMRAL